MDQIRNRGSIATRVLLSELTFVLFPIVIFAVVWPEKHPPSVWVSAEIPMTSSLLFGLSISRFVKGILNEATFAPQKSEYAGRKFVESSISIIAILILLLGISTLLMVMTIFGEDSNLHWFSVYFFLIISFISFAVCLGYEVVYGDSAREVQSDTTE